MPPMRCVEIKSEEQQALLSLHRARDFVVRQRTHLINMLCSLSAEVGVTFASGVARAIELAQGIVEGDRTELPELAQDVLRGLSRQWSTYTIGFSGMRSRCAVRLGAALAVNFRCWTNHCVGCGRNHWIGPPVPKRS